MANTRTRNVVYIDATGTITVPSIVPIVYAMLITPSTNTGRFTLKESVSGMVVIDYAFKDLASFYTNFDIGLERTGVELFSSFEVSSMTGIATCLLYGRFAANTGRAR